MPVKLPGSVGMTLTPCPTHASAQRRQGDVHLVEDSSVGPAVGRWDNGKRTSMIGRGAAGTTCLRWGSGTTSYQSGRRDLEATPGLPVDGGGLRSPKGRPTVWRCGTPD